MNNVYDDYYYYATYGNGLGNSGLGIFHAIAGALAGLLIFFAAYVVICWVFKSIGLYTMAKERGIAHAWFAWIPVLSAYVTGELINDKVVFGKSMIMKEAAFFLPIIEAVGLMAAGFHGALGSIISFACWIVYIAALYRLFGIYDKKHQMSFTVWSIFLRPGFFLFAVREKEPYDPLNPDKVYKHYYTEEHNIREAERQANEEIDRQVDNEVNQVREHYAQLLDQDITEDEKEELRKQRDDEIRSLLDRAQEAKDHNAKIASQFKKVAEEAPTDADFDNYVEDRIEQADEEKVEEAVDEITEELNQDFKKEEK